MVDAYVVSHLQESLGLSDEQYVKVLPLVTKLQGDRREYFLGRGHVIREMRRLAARGRGERGRARREARRAEAPRERRPGAREERHGCARRRAHSAPAGEVPPAGARGRAAHARADGPGSSGIGSRIARLRSDVRSRRAGPPRVRLPGMRLYCPPWSRGRRRRAPLRGRSGADAQAGVAALRRGRRSPAKPAKKPAAKPGARERSRPRSARRASARLRPPAMLDVGGPTAVLGLSEEEQIREAKYLPRELPKRLFEEERFVFPETYGVNRVRLLVRDPEWVFAYWDVSPEAMKELARSAGRALARALPADAAHRGPGERGSERHPAAARSALVVRADRRGAAQVPRRARGHAGLGRVPPAGLEQLRRHSAGGTVSRGGPAPAELRGGGRDPALGGGGRGGRGRPERAHGHAVGCRLAGGCGGAGGAGRAAAKRKGGASDTFGPGASRKRPGASDGFRR